MGKSLSSYSKGAVKIGGLIDKQNTIAFINGKDHDTLQIDLNGDGVFEQKVDFEIEIVGNSNKLVFNTHLDMFVLV